MKYLLLFFTLCSIMSCNSKKSILDNKKGTPTITLDSLQTKKAGTMAKLPKPKIEEKTETDSILTPVTKTVVNIKYIDHSSWNTLLKKNVSNSGNVNYKGLKNNRKTLLNYIAILSKNIPNNEWSKADKLAYWINAYNAMTVDLILRHYPIKSIKDIKTPWDQRFWKLGDKWYNLNEIEHQILRKMNEPRIHFAIVCASYSCPKLQNEAFTASNIEMQLTKVTKEFLSDSERNSISKNSVELSKIFQWFAKDFKQSGSLIDFLNQYTAISISAKAKKTFKDYNWDLNE